MIIIAVKSYDKLTLVSMAVRLRLRRGSEEDRSIREREVAIFHLAEPDRVVLRVNSNITRKQYNAI